ncbi:Sigma-70, region 4 [Sinosporangium album]|uniref:Sigma-70, region 4 n=1 Tax=Sinosporangium album TaxID=504805 RepID=A0A1G8CNC6_9ACTN|nr:helix-turn-helix domain-containing protein [Sinosporangium album]SDH46884.1 Sigma-70, region 4 [Sinosporangium album]
MPSAVRLTNATLDVLDVFASAAGEPVYGLQIATLTKRPTGTVYPLLTRLEKVGWLEGTWESAGHRGKGPRRRYYRLTSQGQEHVTIALRKRDRDRPAAAASTPPVQNPAREPGGPVSSDLVVAEFTGELRALRAQAGNPSLRQLAVRTYYSPAALSEAFSGRGLPSERLLEAIVWACGGDLSEWAMRRNLAEQSIRYGVRIPVRFPDFYPLGMRWALDALARVGLSSADDEDIAQETMLTAHQRWHDVVSTTPDLRRWVTQQVARRAQHMRALPADPLPEADEPENPAVLTVPDLADDVVERFAVGDLLKQLDTRTAQVVYLRAAGFPVKDIAELVQLTPVAVHGRLGRARHRLRVARMEPISPQYAEYLKHLVRLRERAGMPTLRDIAAQVGYSHTHIATVLDGRAPLPSWDFTARLVRTLGGGADAARELWIEARQPEPEDPDSFTDLAARTGDTFALWKLADQLERAGKADQAAGVWRTAAALGNTYAMSVMADLLERGGDTAEAEAWLRRAAEAGDGEAKRELTRLLEKTDRAGEAIQMWRQTPGTEAKRELTRLLEKTGRINEAVQLWQQAAAGGGIQAIMELAAVLDRAGRAEEATSMWRQAAAGGNRTALKTLASRLARAGQVEQACAHLRRAADAGDISAMRELAVLLEQDGRVEEAIETWRRAADAGGASALRELAVLLEQAGFIDEAIETWHRAADAGVDIAQEALSRLERKPISILRAESALHRAASAGDSLAILGLADLLSAQGRSREAEEVLRKAAVEGDAVAAHALADRQRRREFERSLLPDQWPGEGP